MSCFCIFEGWAEGELASHISHAPVCTCAVVYVHLNAFLMKPTYGCMIVLQIVLSFTFVGAYVL